MRTSRLAMLITGCLCALIGLALLAAAFVVLWGNYLQRDGGDITLPQENYETSSPALLSHDMQVFDSANLPEVFGVDDLGHLTFRVTATDPDRPVFVGVGPTEQVQQYLNGVAHSVIDEVTFDPFRVGYDQIPGRSTISAPTSETFWAGQVSGSGRQELTWEVDDGAWTVVIMNADGAGGVSVDVQPGIHVDFLGPLAAAVLVAAAFFVLIGTLLIVVGALGLNRKQPTDVIANWAPGSASPTGPAMAPSQPVEPHPHDRSNS